MLRAMKRARRPAAPPLLPDLDLALLPDAATRRLVQQVLDLVETQAQTIADLRAANQALRDELARLTGEQAKPTVRPAAAPAQDYSSEAERRTPTPRPPRAKRSARPIDRVETLSLDRASLPADARFKGYQHVVVQELVLRQETICFRRAKYYAPSTGKTYLAPLPPGYQGQFGPELKQFALSLYWQGTVSEASLLTVLQEAGVQIGAGTLSRLLTEDRDLFTAEAAAVTAAGLASTPVQQLDETSTRVNGQNQSCHVLCNDFYTAFRTLPGKDRLSVLSVLSQGRPRLHLADAGAAAWLTQAGVAQRTRAVLAALPQDAVLDAATFERLLAELGPGLGPQQQQWLREATAVAAYQAGHLGPVVDTLLTDDAPQEARLTRQQALCWVHDGRHYKKLVPYTAANQQLLATFRKDYWAYYRELVAYRATPTAAEAARLGAAFDTLFSRETGYAALDDRIAKTNAKRAQLLVVLDQPAVPLHNNAAELGARRRVRKRDVSFGPRTAQGAAAWDTFQTLGETTRKLGVRFGAYLRDRLRGAAQIPRLDAVLRDRALTLAAEPARPAPPCP
jgi:Transposase IS66 family